MVIASVIQLWKMRLNASNVLDPIHKQTMDDYLKIVITQSFSIIVGIGNLVCRWIVA